MSIDWNFALFILPFLALGVALAALALSILMHRRVTKIFRSASASDIEKLLKLHTKTLEDLLKFQAEANNYMQHLHQRLKKKVGTSETMRFNPFQGEGVGGNQSFSSLFADEEGEGVVITSMHMRERTNVFAKPLKNWESAYELSDEEKKVIENSKTKK